MFLFLILLAYWNSLEELWLLIFVIILIYCFSKIYLYIWQSKLQREGERGRALSSTGLLPRWPSQSRELEVSLRSSTWMAASQVFGPSNASFPRLLSGAGLEKEEPGCNWHSYGMPVSHMAALIVTLQYFLEEVRTMILLGGFAFAFLSTALCCTGLAFISVSWMS